jgi:glycosyltransferase involved in cell wall biosynthesis
VEDNYAFYPAANHAHKNFKLLFDFAAKAALNGVLRHKIVLTITKDEFFAHIPENNETISDQIENFVFMGPMDHLSCLNLIKHSSLIIFPSLEETLGLPLLEGVALGKPIFVLNKNYSRNILTDAYFFDCSDSLLSLYCSDIEALPCQLKNEVGVIKSWKEFFGDL